MRFRDGALAALTSVIWGFGFVVIKLGLSSFSAPQLTALRFIVAALPVFLVPRPKIAWPRLALIGLTLFTGQFLLLFFAIAAGLPAGLASVTQQTQVFFTVLLAAIFLREIPSLRQGVGMTVAFAGLALIGATVGADLPPMALGLALAGAFSWAVGNILVKRAAEAPVLSLVVWASLVPPLPALVVSRIVEPNARVATTASKRATKFAGAVARLGRARRQARESACRAKFAGRSSPPPRAKAMTASPARVSVRCFSTAARTKSPIILILDWPITRKIKGG